VRGAKVMGFRHSKHIGFVRIRTLARKQYAAVYFCTNESMINIQ
jgi:hypothetical protein